MNFSKFFLTVLFSSFRAEYEPFTINDMISSKIKEINDKIQDLNKIKYKLIKENFNQNNQKINRVLSFKENINTTLNDNDIELLT
jgi:hypothetical protein